MTINSDRPKCETGTSARQVLNRYNTESYLKAPITDSQREVVEVSITASLINLMMEDLDQDSTSEVALMVWEKALCDTGNRLPDEPHLRVKSIHASLNAYMPDGILNRIRDYDEEWHLASRERDFPSPYQALFLDDQNDAAIATAISDRWFSLHESHDLPCQVNNHWGLPWSNELPIIDVDSPPHLEDLIAREIAAWRHSVQAAIRHRDWVDIVGK